MKYSNSIEYNISTKLDKSGLTQLQTQIKQVELTMQQMANRELISAPKVQAAREQLQGLSTALTKSFNPSLGMLDLSKFRAELTESKVTAEGLQTAFSLTGAQGAQAFGTLAKQIGNFNNGIERTSSTLDKMFVTFSNTFRWGLISSFFSQFMNAIHQSVQYAKDLDDSLTQIMLVTDYSRDSMNEYAKAANEAAKAVGQTTVGMTNASLIFAQQGYDLDQSQQLATLSAKLANASQQDTAATSDQITAYMNAYGLQDDMEALSQAMDNWARIANVSAADVEEIALASQRAASMANAVGVSGEALAAQIATIESVTREAPEQIGNGLKTLYARFSDLKLGKDDEDGIGLGKVTSTLQAIGVQVLDAFGNVRDMDAIMEDLMVVWEDLDDTSKTAAAQALAGKHQVNRFMALMENSDMYREYLGETGANATGTLEQMNTEYLDSLQGRMTKLQSTLEGLFNDVFTTDMVYPLIDALTGIADAIDTLFKSIGSGPNIILGLAAAFTQLFSQNIARGINDMISNQQIANIRKSNLSNVQGTLEQTGLNNTGVGQYIQAGADRANAMNAEQYRVYKEQLDNYVTAAQNAAAANEKLEDTYLAVGAAAGLAFKDTDLIFKDEESIINTNNLVEQLKEFANNKDIMKQFAAIDFTESIKGAEKFSHSLAVLEDALQRLKNEDENNFDWNLDRAVDSIELTRDALLDLHDAGALTNDEFNEAKNVIEAAFDELAEDGKIEKNATALDNLNVKMARFAEALKHIGPEVLAKGPEAIQAAIQEYIASIEALEGASDTAKGVINNLDMQNLINSVVSAVGALQQLAFGIQSLQNLGSILSDKNISDSERLLKIIINLGTAIPSIAFAFKTLKKASDDLTASISKQAIVNAQLSTSETLAAVKSGEITASLAAQTIATKLATKAVQGLSTALKFLGGPGGALLIAAITAINMILNGLKQKAEEAKEAVQEAIEDFNNNYNRTQVDTSNFDKLYEEYKRTGVASDELTNAGKQLAEQLGIVGGSALAASGNFTELAGEISNAKEEALLLADIEANNAINNIVERNESQRKDLSAAWYEDFGQQIDTGNMNVLEDAEAQFFSTNVTQQAGVYREEIRKTNEELDRLNTIRREMAKNPEITQAELDEIDSQITETQNHLTSLQNNYTTFYGDLDKIINPMAELQMQNLSAEDFLGLSYEEIVDVLVGPNSSYQWIREAYEAKGGEAGEAYLNGIVRSMNPEAWAQAQMAMLQSNINNSDNRYASGQAQALSQLENFGTEYNLSNVQLMDIAQFIDWDSPNLDQELADLLQRIRDALKAGVSVDDFIAIEQAGGPEEYLRNITSDQVDNEALQKSALTLYNNNDYMDQYANDLEQVPPLIKEITEAQLRYNEAVEFSASNMEKWNNTLEDLENGNANLEDLTDTMDDLRETYSDFLDLTDDVSDSFIRNRKNLKLLEEAINGNEEAYEDLAEAAAKDIISQLGEDLDISAINEATDAIEGLYDIIDNEDFEALDIGELINVDSFPGLYDYISTLVSYFASLGMGIDEIQQKILELTGIYIPTDNFEIASNNIGDSFRNAADTAAAAGNNVMATAEQTAASIADHFSFGQKVEVDQETAAQTDNLQYTNLIANTVERHKTVTMPAGDGEDGSSEATFFDLVYEPRTWDVPSTKETTGQAVKSEVLPGKSGANSSGVTLKNPSSGGTSGWRKGPTGGSKSSGSAAPRSSGGTGCFVAGTLVSLQNQFKNIEDIQIGDIVLSYNEEIHQNEYSIVLQTMIHDVTEEIYDLYIEDEILTVTGIHRFYIRRKHDIEWVPASDLHIGDYVLFADGNWHPIFKIKIKVRSLLVYNFEVSHNHNYYVGRNQILAHNKGGGGGGGGSKAKTIQPKEKRTHKKDYYEKVDSQLDKIKEQLSGIEKQEDKLIGDKARANQTKQLALLKREVDLQKEKLDILKTKEMPDVDKELKKQYNSLKTFITNQGLNIELPVPHLNEDNIYDNFEDVSKAVDDVYNALIEKYNAAAAAGDEETTKAIDELIKKMDEEGKGVLDNIQKHNDLQKTQVEWTNAIQDTIDAMQDLKIEAYKTSMEAIDDLKDLNKEWAEFEGFLTGLPTDSPFRSLTEDLSELNSSFEITKKEAKGFYNEIIKEKQKALAATSDATEKQAIQLSIDYFKGLRDSLTDDMLENGLLGLAMEDLEELRKWYENPSLEGNPFGDNRAALKEAYEDALKRVIELTQDWQDLQEEIIDDIVDGYGEIADKQERQMSDYERLADRMEKFADLYALSYGEKSYKALSEIGNKQAETLKHQLSQQVNIYNYWADQYQKALDSGNEKLINEMKDKMDEAEDNMLDLAQDAAETFIDAYEKSIEAAIQKFNEKVIGDVDFDYLDLTWEWQDRLADGYLDDVESAFEIDKLRANYTDLLNDAQGASLATQNKIRQQMNEQLSILEDQETVSEYDVELANAKLNLLQKEIALEDAQRNKNQMQLRRDSQGNYRYVYRADQDEVNKAQREVFEAQQNIYKISKNHIEEVKKDIADIIKNYEEGIRKIANDPYLTEAEKEAKIKELTDYVNSIMPVLKEEFETAQNGIKTSLNESIDKAFTNSAAAAEEMLGKILDKEGKFKTDSGIIWWDSANELTQKVFPAISEAMGKLSATAKTEGEKLRENLTGNSGVLSMISEDLSTKDGYTTSIEDAAKKTIALDTATAGLNTQLQQETKDLQNVIKKVSSYNATLEKASQDLRALQKDYDNLKKTMADKLPNKIPGEIPAAEKKEDSKPKTTTTTTTNTNKDTKPTTNTNKLNKDKVIGAYNEIMSGRAGNGDARWRYLSGKGYTDAEQNAAQEVVNAVFGGSSRDAALKKIVGYATGGYTGEWNNDGKLAVLHQKELVLNAEDTRNILSAVDIVRQMTSTLGNALTNYSLRGASSSLMNSGFGEIEQRVEIKAEFPNVRDSFEIETALTNLADRAYQYAHRNI